MAGNGVYKRSKMNGRDTREICRMGTRSEQGDT